MKIITTLIAFIAASLTIHAQVTNIKAGNWSDNTIWSSSLVPTAEDDVELNFDVTIDINAVCLSFNSNGHNVTVKAGANLTTLGSNADTLLSEFITLIPGITAIPDTAKICRFTYDAFKRNTAIDMIEYDNADGIMTKHVYSSFFYAGNSRWPFKKTDRYLYMPNPADTGTFAEFYQWQNDAVIFDSLEIPSYVTSFQYLPDSIIQTTKTFYAGSFDVFVDSLAVTWQNGNMIKQVGPFGIPNLYQYDLSFDNKPNPFYYTNYKITDGNSYPLYSSRTWLNNVFGKNNPLTTLESEDGFHWEVLYQYRPNGYPAMAYYSNFGISAGYYRYHYTH